MGVFLFLLDRGAFLRWPASFSPVKVGNKTRQKLEDGGSAKRPVAQKLLTRHRGCGMRNLHPLPYLWGTRTMNYVWIALGTVVAVVVICAVVFFGLMVLSYFFDKD